MNCPSCKAQFRETDLHKEISQLRADKRELVEIIKGFREEFDDYLSISYKSELDVVITKHGEES